MVQPQGGAVFRKRASKRLLPGWNGATPAASIPNRATPASTGSINLADALMRKTFLFYDNVVHP